ncbi:MAG: methyltransferase domain-containing protein [Deltaproteobacteria bacterium]|nr:methyltransferase domain-containing protein [Deltaproteobacteria bacterium]
MATPDPAAPAAPAPAVPGHGAPLKVAIVVVAYNAVGTLAQVLGRIPPAMWERVEEVIVFDDSSQDDTYLVALGYREHARRVKMSVLRNEANLGYGGNQKRAYRYAIDKGYDVVALLHGDGQYAPELLPELLAPLERGEADAVFGSRMMERGRALRGGMPLYKYVGNRILSEMENLLLGMSLSEFHSGYRLYSLRALAQLPFERNTDDFHFDTQIIIQLHAAGMRIVELPIPTYYGSEICYVSGLRYAWNVTQSVLRFRGHELGLRAEPAYELAAPYRMKQSPLGSHARILQLCGPGPRRILDVGCGTGELAQALAQRGHAVAAVGASAPRRPVPDFVAADLTQGLPLDPARRFDIVILADVLEHLPDPLRLLREASARLDEGGLVLVSLPNAVHWSVRAQVVLGRFDYTNRGLLDRGHLRFFTRATAERLFADAGLAVAAHETTPIPWENVIPPSAGALARSVERVDYFFTRLLSNLCAYQHLFVLRRCAATP